jgi:hypothetical protein
VKLDDIVAIQLHLAVFQVRAFLKMEGGLECGGFFVEVDLLAQKEYFSLMETVTLKMDRKHIALLREQAKVLGRSQAAVVRDLIQQHLAPKKRLSLYERAKDLCGSLRGPRNLSTRPLTGYGRN